jgi:hypothetical protein
MVFLNENIAASARVFGQPSIAKPLKHSSHFPLSLLCCVEGHERNHEHKQGDHNRVYPVIHGLGPVQIINVYVLSMKGAQVLACEFEGVV